MSLKRKKKYQEINLFILIYFILVQMSVEYLTV